MPRPRDRIKPPTGHSRSQREERARKSIQPKRTDRVDASRLFRPVVASPLASLEGTHQVSGHILDIEYPILTRRQITKTMQRIGEEETNVRLDDIVNDGKLPRTILYFAEDVVIDQFTDGTPNLQIWPAQEVYEQMRPELDLITEKLEISDRLQPLKIIAGRYSSRAAAQTDFDIVCNYLGTLGTAQDRDIITFGKLQLPYV